MGVHTFVYRLLHLLPPFQNVRVPGRFAAIALAAVAVLAASGASRVLSAISRPREMPDATAVRMRFGRFEAGDSL